MFGAAELSTFPTNRVPGRFVTPPYFMTITLRA